MERVFVMAKHSDDVLDVISKEQCCGCQACAQACPKQCILMKADKEGFLYPHIEESLCIKCGVCKKVCPILCPEETEPVSKKPTAYAAVCLDEKIRSKSSSGGIFTLLAERTLSKGGVVIGAAMTHDQRGVHHIAVETNEKLAELRGSKYMQSSIGDTYSLAQKMLQNGREVLFSGTPCQIEGLYAFLQKDYPNLCCVDLICHGVPSPFVWSTYLEEQEKCANASVWRTFFRNKKCGWKTYAVLLEFSNNTAYERVFFQDAYMQAFLQNICLRPSCYKCRFKKLNRISDITLADYWGIQDQYPDMDDNKGTSLALIHSEKGQYYLDMCYNQLRLKEVPVLQAISGNPSMLRSACPHRYRKQFFDHLGKIPFDRLVEKYCKRTHTLKELVIILLKQMQVYSIIQKLKRICIKE